MQYRGETQRTCTHHVEQTRPPTILSDVFAAVITPTISWLSYYANDEDKLINIGHAETTRIAQNGMDQV